LCCLTIILLLKVRDVAAQQEQYFEEPAKPRFSFQWDFLARYDRIDHLVFREEVERGRFELRPEVDFDPSDRFRIGARGVFDYGTEEDYENYINFDNYRSRGSMLERYYILARPGTFAIRAGAFGMPLAASEMLWDRDIQTLGAAVAWERLGGALTLAAAGFYGPQRNHDHSRIGVGQAIWRTGDENRLQLEAAASYWGFDMRNLDPGFIRQNTLRMVDGEAELASKFHVGDLLLRLRFSVGTLPALVSLDGIRNFEGASGKKSAFEGVLAVGRLGTPGHWRVFYAYQYVERDALVGAYNTDDWWFHTWYEGHRAGVAVTILPQVYVQFAGTLQRRLDRPNWLNRYTLDLVKMF
jgi:hypothetical protein